MGDGSRQLNEAHPVPSHPALCDLNATTLTNNPAVPDSLVLTAMAFPILRGTKNLFAEQAVHLGLERAVVDRFRLGHFSNDLSVRQGALTPLHDPVR